LRVLQRNIALALLTALLLTGCATPYVNQHIEAVNAEYRALEAYSYELEHENEKLSDQLQMLTDENTKLKGGTVPPRKTGPFSAPRSRTPSSTPSSTPPRSAAPAFDPEAPMIEVPDSPAPMPAPSLPPVPRTPPPGRSSTTAPRSSVSTQKPAENSLQLLPSAPKPPRPILEDPPPEPNIPASELPAPPLNAPEGATPEPIDGRVTHLFLNPLLTRGANLDSTPGDDGLSLVLEPRNQAGEYVPQAAAVSIVVLDPTKSGDAARVARWNLDEKLVKQRISHSNGTRGIHLQLPWAGGTPETNQVKLFVRYQTADGRSLEAQHDVILNPASQASQRWTPRPGDRPRTTMPTAPIVNTLPPTTQPSVTAANPPLPAPAVQSDLTKVTPPPTSKPAPNHLIQEPPALQTDVAKKDPVDAGNSSPPLLQPPPAKRPEWQPFR
jgi:hypothetical protein